MKHIKRRCLWPAVLAAVLLTLLCGQRAGAVPNAAQNGAGFVRPGSITVVCDDNYPPYIFRNSEGQVQGIVVDQWKAWEKATGVRVVLQAMDWGLAQRNMREGKADVIDTIFYNEARAKIYDFTKPYAQLDVPVFFHKSLGGINDVQALRGFTVGVKAGDAVIDVLESYGINSLKEFDSYEGIINAARAGDIRIFSIDAPPALYYLYKYNLESEFRQGFVLYSGAFHRAVRKGDTDLLALVEQGFATIPAGEGKAIEEKWLGAPIVSRYNLRLVFLVFCGIAAVTLVLGFLNILLRRRVRAKVAELSATLGELRTSEERFRTIFNSVSDLIFIHAWPSGRTLDVNQRACEVYGYTREEMLSLPVEITSAGYPPYDQVHAMELMRKAYEGTPQVAEWRAKRRDGSLFWVEVSIRRALVLGQEHILVSCRDIDQRKRAEEALQASENTLRSLFASMTDVILILDSQGRYLEIAPTNTDRLYKPPAELLGRTLSEVFPPEQADYCLGIIRRALESGTTVSTDYHMAIGDKTIWFAGNVSPLSADRVIWVARDITERKKAEEALFESRERLQLALDAANDGLWDWRVDSGEVYFSPRCYTLLGYKPGEFPADFASFSKHLHPDDLATISTAAETFLKDTETSALELRMRAKFGEWKWILTRSRVVDRNALGAPVRLVGTSTDITERKRSEQALGESEERYRTLFEQSLDAIAIQEGLSPVFSWVNPAFCELFGYSPEELYALSTEDIWRLVHPDDRDLVRHSLTDRMAGRRDGARYSFRIIRKGGDVRWVDVTGRRMQQGDRPMNLSIYRDNTERKMYEEALTQARDAADAANRAKSEFLANMSHEIRTPLNGIVGMIQLLDGSALTGEQKRYAQAAIQSSQRLTSLLGDILDLSRIEARKFVLMQRPFMLRDILDSVETLYRLPAGQKGLELDLRLDPDLPKWLSGDDHRLRQVLSNLVGNAVKFTPSGEILVEVQGLRPCSKTQCRVLFVVSDTGVGIPLESLDQAFQMFTQVEGSLSRKHQGAGLGLAIVRHLVSLLGGPGIDVSSEVGTGTTFSFVLPFGVPEPDAIRESALPGDLSGDYSGAQAEAPSLVGLRVLLVEDEEINQLALRTGLERQGLLVTCASDGEAALAALRVSTFDCVLMDIQMPGLNGLEATQAIRTRPEFKDCANIPVIALTAFAMVGDRERFLAAGMDDYLAKPFSFEDLARILGRIRSARLTRLDTTE